MARPDRPVSAARVVVVAALIAAVVVLRLVLAAGGDVTGLVAFGEESTGITAHASEVLGREVVVRPGLGHDGRFFFVQAEDPWHRQPDRYAILLDRPTYRSQRMLYPLLAGLGGLAPATWLPWTMTLANAVALVVLAAGVGSWARRHGASAWWGLAVFADIGILFEVDIAGAGVVALATAVWGTLATERGRPGRAAAWFTAAVLAREVMAVWVAGVVVYHWWCRVGGWVGLTAALRRPRCGGIRRLVPADLVVIAGVPAVTAVAWGVYLRLRLGTGTGAGEVREIGPPFGGMFAAVDDWITAPDLAVQMLAIVAVCLAALVAAVRRPSGPVWAAAGFSLLAVLLTEQVWWRPFDVGRAVAPVPVGLVLGWLAWRHRAVEPAGSGVATAPVPVAGDRRPGAGVVVADGASGT